MWMHAMSAACLAVLLCGSHVLADGQVPKSEYDRADAELVPQRAANGSTKNVDSAEAAKKAQDAQAQRRASRADAKSRSLSLAAERRAAALKAREAKAASVAEELAKQAQEREKAWQALESFAGDTYPDLKALVADMRKRSEAAAEKSAEALKARHDKRVEKGREDLAKQLEKGGDIFGDLFKLPGTGEKSDGPEGEANGEAKAGAAAAKLMLMFFGF